MATILVVDDKESVRSSFAMILRREGHKVILASGVEDALGRLQEKTIDIVLTDLKMPLAEEGLRVVEGSRQLPRRPAVIVVTGYGSIRSAVEAMKLGADDYVTKPLRREEIIAKVESSLSRLENLRTNDPGSLGFKEIIGESPRVLEAIEQAQALADTDEPILMQGESGTGRRLLARAVHVQGPRARGPFMTLDGSAIDVSAFEHAAEQGVHERASPTIPEVLRPALGGVVYIENLEEVPLSAQAGLVALLRLAPRVPQSTSSPSVPIEGVRVMASTSVDLEEKVREGSFRSDLFYILSRGIIRVPSLRDRAQDIPLLAKHFLKRIASSGRPLLKLGKDARKRLLEHRFPGNVRELEALVDRAASLCSEEEITPEILAKLGLKIERPQEPGDIFKWSVADAEREAIEKVVNRHPRDLAGAANELGISRTTLWRKMKKYGMIGSEATLDSIGA